MVLLKKRVPKGPIGASKPAPIGPGMDRGKVLELINRKQRQIIVHSVIYYRLNSNIINDDTWNTWARELVLLQRQYPDIAAKSAFWEDMKDFDGSTGYHLADNAWGYNVAMRLIRTHAQIRTV